MNKFDDVIKFGEDSTTKLKRPEWLEESKTPAFGSGEVDARWSGLGLDLIALNGGPTHLFKKFEGNVIKTLEELTADLMEKWGFKTVSKCFYPTLTQVVYSSGNSLVELEYSKLGEKFVCGIDTNDEKVFTEFAEWVQPLLTHKVVTGQVHVLVSTQGGLDFDTLGLAGHKIERENYSDEVLFAFDKVVKDLQSETPTGRLSIFNGPPGTGKTFMVKALLEEHEDAVFVIIPQHLASELASPSIIPSLINLKKSARGQDVPIVFIIEDADTCLVNRETANNMSVISSVLNLCDGIVGELLDIRIISTTNANKVDIDPALLRPGRCSAHVEVGKLPIDKANAVLRKLVGNETEVLPENREWSLAEVYNFFHEGRALAVGTTAKKQKPRIGFGA